MKILVMFIFILSAVLIVQQQTVMIDGVDSPMLQFGETSIRGTKVILNGGEYITNGGFETDPIGEIDPWSDLSDWDLDQTNGGTAWIIAGKSLKMINADSVNDVGKYTQQFVFTYNEGSDYNTSGSFRLIPSGSSYSQAVFWYYYFLDSSNATLGYIMYYLCEDYQGYSNSSGECMINLSPWPANDPGWGDTGWISFDDSLLPMLNAMSNLNSAGERATIAYVKPAIVIYTSYDNAAEGYFDNLSLVLLGAPAVDPAIIDWFESTTTIDPGIPIVFYATVEDNDTGYGSITVILYYSNDTFGSNNKSRTMVFDEEVTEDNFRFNSLMEGKDTGTYFDYYYTADDGQESVRSPAAGGEFYNIKWQLAQYGDPEGEGPPYEPDIDIMDFLSNQLRVAIGIFPWLLLIGMAIGMLYFCRNKFKGRI